MIEAIQVRLGLICLAGLLAVVDSEPLRDGQIPAAASSAPQAVEDRISRTGVPDWFVQNHAYTDADGMLYVRTRKHCMNIFEAEEELGRECLVAVNRILDQWLGQSGAADRIGLSENEVLDRLLFDGRKSIRIDDDPEIDELRRQYNIAADDDYYCGFAQLHLGDDFRAFTRKQWQQVQTRERLISGGLAGGSVLAILAIAFGYLKLESATRGFYSRRLQTVALLLITAALVGIFWIRQIVLVWSQ